MPPKGAARQTTPRRSGQGDVTSINSTGADSISQSTATAPSPTPGPSGRPSVQRLQSLNKRKPPGSIAPAGRSPSALSGEPAKPTLKYRPRAVQRKSKEEREAIEKVEQDRLNERLKEAAAIQRGRGNRGGRGSFRGRGGPVGMGGSGPLGAGFGSRGRGRGGASGGFDRVRSAISGGGRAHIDDDSDDDDNELRVSIDQINIESDDEYDEPPRNPKGKLPIRQREGGLRPVRVERHEHEERVISVNMESSSNKSKAAEIRHKTQEESQAAPDVGQRVEEELVEEVRVKAEPADDEDTPMADVLPHAEDDGFLPTQKVRVRRKIPDHKKATEAEKEAEQPPLRDPRELLRTKEEIDEYDRHLEDLAHVRDLFCHEEPEQAEEPQTVAQNTEAEEGDVTEGSVEKQQDNVDKETEDKSTNPALLGQLFLMQFPPMTPNLTIPSLEGNAPAPNETTNDQAEIKAQTEGASEDVQITDAPVSETPQVITATTDWSLPAGRAGKLNVHKSGRVTLDWGGISFELDRASTAGFVQEALIVSSSEADEGDIPPKPDETRHQAWSMGQLSGKFTVMPDWDRIL
ncbi:uncharacterized protein N7459_002823 [Penicillium hispanicum]|uniref:uncharacterized protein n=1 Tax=Penicillium hispanicum TaxID=1080232 RepID=UPI002541D1BB|nr:uncharacterized protein N7459_002823 [Penicillium hispanicum]KAJ5587058.1 hypothetical protein N7459_002823 [Penicillium hispanicum]